MTLRQKSLDEPRRTLFNLTPISQRALCVSGVQRDVQTSRCTAFTPPFVLVAAQTNTGFHRLYNPVGNWLSLLFLLWPKWTELHK